VNFDSASQIAGHQLLESWGSSSREQCQLGKTRSTYRSPGVGAGTATPESALLNASYPSECSWPEGAVTVGSGFNEERVKRDEDMDEEAMVLAERVAAARLMAAKKVALQNRCWAAQHWGHGVSKKVGSWRRH